MPTSESVAGEIHSLTFRVFYEPPTRRAMEVS